MPAPCSRARPSADAEALERRIQAIRHPSEDHVVRDQRHDDVACGRAAHVVGREVATRDQLDRDQSLLARAEHEAVRGEAAEPELPPCGAEERRAALTLLAKERSGPELAAQVLFYPVTDASFDTGSYHEFATGYFLRRDAMQWFWDQYTTDEAERDEPTASPLRADLDQLAGLPPVLVITAEADVLRDEGEAYADKLRQAGVPITATRYLGIIHDFVMLNALRGTAAAEAAITHAVSYLGRALHTTA